MAKKEKNKSQRAIGSVGKIMDPVFVCMCAAVAIAIGSSLLLRIMSGGPSSVRATDADIRGEMIFPALPKLPAEFPALSPPPATHPSIH